MNKITEVWVGVDISKDNLDIFINSIGRFLSIENSESAVEKFIQELSPYKVQRIVCEATGGYEKLLATTLKKHGYSLWIVDPKRIKGFKIASGCKSKTDKTDAKKIAEFAAKNSPDYEVINKTENQNILQALTNRRKDLSKFLVAEKTRLKHPSHSFCTENIQDFIKILKSAIEEIDLQIKDLVQKDEDLSKKSELLESIPGIGKTSAATLLSSVPELGLLNNKEISALVGVGPYDNSSGDYTGKKFIKGGRMTPRNMLYMCALATIKWHPPLKEFYDRLIAKKKPFKVAIVAVMRKLIILANAILKKGELCRKYS